MRGAAYIALVSILWCSSSQAAQPTDMVDVPAGSFTMGSNAGPTDEEPMHEVHLERYAIDRYPVTNAQYAEFLKAHNADSHVRSYDNDDPDARIHRLGNTWKADAGYEHHPVVEVPWAGALAYCSWRGKRLPTEAEWEKAARGADARRYPWGNEPPDSARAQFTAGYNRTSPVDAHPAGASPYGAHDMSGNTWEWVASLYRPYPYRADDGREDLRAPGTRGTRGGGHDSPAGEITTTQRGRSLSRNPLSGHHNIGFRCAR